MKSLEGKDDTCMMVSQNGVRIMGGMWMASDSAKASGWRCSVFRHSETQKH